MRKRLWLSLLLLLPPLLAFSYWYFVIDAPAPRVRVSKETTYITEPVDADGYPDYQAALNNRLGKGITPDNNANVLIWKALGPKPEGGTGMPAEYFKRLGIDEPPKDGDYFVGFSKYGQDRLGLQRDELDALFDQQSWATKRPWTAEDYPHIAAWIEANDKPLAIVMEATKRPEYFNPVVSRRKDNGSRSMLGALIPSVQKCRELACALTGRAMLRTAAGKFDDAWQDLLACHRLARLIARGASLIEALVGNAIDQIASQADLAYLERADLSGQQARDRLKDLQALPPFQPLADQIDLFERFMYLEALQLMSRGSDVLDGGVGNQSTAADKKDMVKIDLEPAFISGNQWYDRLAAALRQEDRAERTKEFDQIDNDLKTLKNNTPPLNMFSKLLLNKKARGKAVGDTFLLLFMPAISKVQASRDRCEQTERNLHLAFALAAYHADNGCYPAKLDDLAPKYLAAIPDDLFSGKALLYRLTEKGYLLYSVGVNGKDDGGRQYDDDPPGDDLVVRMPLPELKRKK